MWMVARAVGIAVAFAFLAILKKRWYERLESPIWVGEDRLATGFDRLTGGDRKLLRKLLIALSVMATAAGLGLTAGMETLALYIASIIVVAIMLYLSWGVTPAPSIIQRAMTFGLAISYLIDAVLHGLVQEWFGVAYSLAVTVIRLTDYIVWADHRKPRKQREGESLPEQFLKRIQDAGLMPAGEKA